MKLFRQKDELFEIMGKAAERRRGSLAQAPSAIASAAPTSQAPAATAAAAAAAAAAPPVPTPAPTPSSTPAPALTPTPAKANTQPLARTVKLPSSARPKPITTTSSIGGRPQPQVTSSSVGTRRMPKIPAGFGGPAAFGDDDLLEIDGDALVVVDDGWEDAAPAAAAGGTFAIRADTAIVGGLLAGGLLITAFFVGRTTTVPEPTSEFRPIAPVVIQAAQTPAPTLTQTPNSASTSTPEATSVPASAAPSRGQRAALAAGFQQAPASTAPSSGPPASTSPPATPTPRGKYELQVCSTTPEKAAAVAQWLNEAPRSPIFGRGDLKAVVSNGGSVKIQGFAQREQDVLSRVKATSDPTNGGSGTFYDALYALVR